MQKCAELTRLNAEVAEVLENLTDLTKRQLEAFLAHDHALFMRLDKELENTVGVKERRVGAQRQHVKDHGCQAS